MSTHKINKMALLAALCASSISCDQADNIKDAQFSSVAHATAALAQSNLTALLSTQGTLTSPKAPSVYSTYATIDVSETEGAGLTLVVRHVQSVPSCVTEYSYNFVTEELTNKKSESGGNPACMGEALFTPETSGQAYIPALRSFVGYLRDSVQPLFAADVWQKVIPTVAYLDGRSAVVHGASAGPIPADLLFQETLVFVQGPSVSARKDFIKIEELESSNLPYLNLTLTRQSFNGCKTDIVLQLPSHRSMGSIATYGSGFSSINPTCGEIEGSSGPALRTSEEEHAVFGSAAYKQTLRNIADELQLVRTSYLTPFTNDAKEKLVPVSAFIEGLLAAQK